MNASSKYRRSLRRALALVDRIDSHLKIEDMRKGRATICWGVANDMERTADQLQELMDRLSGDGEYAEEGEAE